MEIHNVFAYDITADDYASRMSVAVKKEQVISSEGFDFTQEVMRRGSMVNIKEFVAEVKNNHIRDRSFVEDGDDNDELLPNDKIKNNDDSVNESVETQDQSLFKYEEKDIQKNGKDEGTLSYLFYYNFLQNNLETPSEEEKVKEESQSNSDSSTPECQNKWFTKVRRHSYSELLEERFLMTVEDNEEINKEKCKKLLEEGKLIENNIANIKYMIKTEAAQVEQNKAEVVQVEHPNTKAE